MRAARGIAAVEPRKNEHKLRPKRWTEGTSPRARAKDAGEQTRRDAGQFRARPRGGLLPKCGRTGTTWSRFLSSGRPMLYLVWRTHSLQARCSPLYKTVVNIATQGGARRRTDGRTELRRAGCKSSCNSEDYPFVDRSIDRSKAGPPILLLFHCLLRLSLTFSHRARARASLRASHCTSD